MLSFCVVVANAFAVTPVVTVPYSPPLFSPPQSLKRSGELRWEVWGTEGSPPAQSDTCLPGSHSKTGSLYLYNCSTESWWTKLQCQAALGRRIASRGATIQWEKQKSQVQVPPKPPRASVKTSGFIKVQRAWIREEAGSLAKAVALNWKVISQWSPWVAISLVFIVSCLSLHSKLVKRHLSKQQVFPSPGCDWRAHT